MVEIDFLNKAVSLLNSKLIPSRDAQRLGDQIVLEAKEKLEAYLDYRVIALSRHGKRRNRLIEKIEEMKSSNPEITPEHAVSQITDMAGGRLLVQGLADVQLAYEFVREFVRTLHNCHFAAEPKEYFEAPKASGFRGVLQRMDVRISDRSEFPYELQFMSFLQHSWDQLHHRVYERTRKEGVSSVPNEVAATLKSLSDRLYRLDSEIDLIQTQTYI